MKELKNNKETKWRNSGRVARRLVVFAIWKYDDEDDDEDDEEERERE